MNDNEKILRLKAQIRLSGALVLLASLCLVWAPVVIWLGQGIVKTIATAVLFLAIAGGGGAIFSIIVFLRAVDRLELEQQQPGPWRSRPRGPVGFPPGQEGPY